MLQKLWTKFGDYAFWGEDGHGALGEGKGHYETIA